MKTNITYIITVNPYRLTVCFDDKAIQSFVTPNELGSTLSALALTGLKLLLRNSYAGRASEASKLVLEKIERIKVGGEFVQFGNAKPTDPELTKIDDLINMLDPETDADLIKQLQQKREEILAGTVGGISDSDYSDYIFRLDD